ncbi:MAG TPA: MFS transporter [Myxococcota bacterium]|nr:MFS transporter [Myxococcota bacterium]
MGARYILGLLLVIYVVNHVDRQVMNILGEAVKTDLGLSDGQLGLLIGGAFAIFYTFAGLPIARFADRSRRSRIITVALLLWSAMTMLCGFARSFAELLVARIGVGVGEAGCTPPAHSMISDSFPAERRATAISFYSLGVPIGTLFGLILGGYLTDVVGWKTAFLVVGAPGVLLALLAGLTLEEPERGRYDGPARTEVEPLLATLRFMAGMPAMRHALAGSAVQTLFLAGVGAFHTSFLVRVHGLSYTETGLRLGLIAGVTGGIAVFGAGWAADRFGQGDFRWQFWIPAAGAVLSIPFSLVAYSTADATLAVACIAGATIFNHTYSGLTHAIMQALVRPRMRATMSAIGLFAMNIVGFGLGPIVVGVLSDHFGGGAEIRYALLSLIVCMGWAAVHYVLGARTYLRDLEAKAA